MTEQAPEPAEKPTETPAQNPAETSPQKPAEAPGGTSAGAPAETSAGTPAGAHGRRPAGASAETSARATAGAPGRRPAGASARTAGASGQTSAGTSAEAVAQTSAGAPGRKPAQTSAEASGQEAVGAVAAKGFLYVVVCAAGVAEGVGTLIAAARERGWEVGVIATPVAMNGFFDSAAVQTLTGRPVRSAWRTPADPRPFPPPDAVAVAPATFNTINKWAAGIADTLAAATLCEAHGLGVPVVALPCVADTLAAHPAYHDSLARLRAMGIRFGDPHTGDHTGDQPQDGGRPAFAWERALDLLDAFPDGPRPRPASVIRYDRPA